MSFPVYVSETAARRLKKLPAKLRGQITTGLRVLEEDPLRPRANADIRIVEGTNPQKYWLRTGDGRAVYAVLNGAVRVIEVFVRGAD